MAARHRHPLEFRWQGELPRKAVREVAGRLARVDYDARFDTGPLDQPFDFSRRMRLLIEDILVRCPELSSLQASRILLAMTQARSSRSFGLQARVTPLRFARGTLTRQRRGIMYQVQRYYLDDQEFYYLMTFCLPRFLDQDFDDKFITIFHELYHLDPECNGDLRRHTGRYHLHTHDQKGYDRQMLELARAYLATSPDPQLHAFLRLNFAQLRGKHGAVHGVVVPRPRIVPLSSTIAASAALNQRRD